MDEFASLADRSVLIVEDEFLIADDLRTAIAESGAHVVGPAPSCAQALMLLTASDKIDIAVLDINLDGEEVYELADELVERGVPFVFATGYDKASLPERYRAVPVWEKPFDAAALVSALRTYEK